MKKLHFEYRMELSFTEPVAETHFTIKCVPKDTDMQRISEVNIELIPESGFQRGEDAFGNAQIYGSVLEEHQSFGFHISGTAETGLSAGEKQQEDEFTGRYLYPFGLNKPGVGIQEYFQSMSLNPETSAYEKAWKMMNRLYQDFSYVKDVTNVNTTAEEAWQQRQGVCQDYAHILIALCHLAKIPARYVAGMMEGEGFSHAWVEVLSEGVWYGIDPTNGCQAGDFYIKLAVGRDAGDCMINKGIIKGGGTQTQNVVVRVEELPI